LRHLLTWVIASSLLAACAGQPPKAQSTLAAPAAPGAVAIAPAAPAGAKPLAGDAEAIYRSTGFRPEVHGGETLYCRDDTQTGSRLVTRHTCLTALQLKQYKEDAERNANRALSTLHGSTAASGQ